jgi:regulator of sigma E protease
MGPKLVSWKGKRYDTEYSLRALPIGGYAAMEGENGGSEDPDAFCSKPVWQRIVVICAGSFMNLLIGLLLTFALVLATRSADGEIVLASNTIHSFQEGATSPAYGLQVEDTVEKVNGVRVFTGQELIYEIINSGFEAVDLVVRRDGQRVVLEDVGFPTMTEEGVVFGDYDFVVYAEETTVGNILKHTVCRAGSTIKMVWDSLLNLVSGRYGLDNVSGPVGITETIGEAAKSAVETGSAPFLYVISIIAMNLGVFNLLPLPALDGGRLLFLLIELVRGKPVDQKFETAVHTAGILLLFGLMILITFKDIVGLFG